MTFSLISLFEEKIDDYKDIKNHAIPIKISIAINCL